MPELPDVAVYLEALRARIVDRPIRKVLIRSPSLLRTYDPPYTAVVDRSVRRLERIGKRIVWDFGDELYAVIHLMIAGRFRWSDDPVSKPPGKMGLASFHFDDATLHVTEASPKKRAGLWIVQGRDALDEHDPGGVDPLAIDADAFAERLREHNRTLKRALTDPRVFSGIGNAYSDEILHRARLSPVRLTGNLTDDEVAGLHEATRVVLEDWTERLREFYGDAFPTKVTAFRDGMAVHGRFERPCPVCGDPVQRLRYAANECNYCVTCQTSGKLLKDRSLSRLLKDDWPKTLEELEELRRR